MSVIGNAEIVKFVGDFCEEEGIKVGIKESIKGGLTTGVTATIAGFMFGPAGLAAGGIIGGITSYIMARGKYESVATVVKRMEPSKRNNLVSIIVGFLNSNGITNMKHLASIVKKDPFLKGILLQLIIDVLVGLIGYVISSAVQKFTSEKSSNSNGINVQNISEDEIKNVSNQL